LDAPQITGTRPPFSVNLVAFASKFHTVCCRRAGSPWTGPARAAVGESFGAMVRAAAECPAIVRQAAA